MHCTHSQVIAFWAIAGTKMRPIQGTSKSENLTLPEAIATAPEAAAAKQITFLIN